jgi:hypothetical protein
MELILYENQNIARMKEVRNRCAEIHLAGDGKDSRLFRRVTAVKGY